MVMKQKAMRKNLTQSILKSAGRYLAIVAIIALGSAMFVGLLMTKTDMVATGQAYMDRQNMFDLRLISSYGWTDDSVEQISRLEGVESAEGVFYLDAVARLDTRDDTVYRFYAIPEQVNQIVLRGGRLPEAPNECLIDGFMADDSYLGMEIAISPGNEAGTKDVFLFDTYTVVGYVSTPLYMDMNRGTTTVGNGSIETYFFVPMDGLDAPYYTEINLTIPGEYRIFTETYNAAMEEAGAALEPLAEPVIQSRFEQIRSEAEASYAEGYAEYLDGVQELEKGKEEARQELADAYDQLTESEQMLADSEKELTNGQAQINSAWGIIYENQQTLDASREELEAAKADAYAQLDAAQAELDRNAGDVAQNMELVEEGLTQVEDGLTQLNDGISQLEDGIAQLNDGIGQLEDGLAQIDQGIAQLEMLMPLLKGAKGAIELALEAASSELIPDTQLIAQLKGELEAAKRELEAYSAQLQELYVMRETYGAQLQELYTMRESYSAQLQELYATRAELEVTRAELLLNRETLVAAQEAINSGYEALTAGRAEADAIFAEAEAQIDDGEAQLQAARNALWSNQQQINEGWAALEEGKQALAEGWADYHAGKAEAEAEIAEGEAKLADARSELEKAREDIDGLEAPELMILDRNSNVGFTSLNSSSDIVQGVARVFPAFFLLVAAMVCITTMTRMIDEERTQIGTLKALGYSNGAIISKYLIYAGSGAVLGCGIGVLTGSALFPNILWQAYKIMLFITDEMVLEFNWILSSAVLIVYTAAMLLVTWYCCRRVLKEEPAELIRPKAPEAGKKILLEYLPFWRRLSFLNKVTLRNIFRYRQRMAMMLLGIGGCTALLLTGFGLRDSIVNVVDHQFDNVTVYDMNAYFTDGQTLREQEAFLDQVAGTVENAMFYHQSSIELDDGNQTKEIYLIAAGEQVQQFMHFYSGPEQLEYPGLHEVLLSVGIAEMMGIQAGDRITMRNSEMQTLELTVSGIYDNHINNYAVLSPDTVAAQWGQVPQQQMAFLKIAEDADEHEIAAMILGMENVLNIAVSEDLADMVGGMMEALDLVVWVAVFCAALLAVIVLYNLTNININERIREIATIKVLGFRASEAAMYVFKENLTLTVAGAVFGLGLGYLLLIFVMSNIKIDFVWFKTAVQAPSCFLALLLTVLAAVVVDFIFYFKLDRINMAEALKSVE